ncbi:MAG: copper resistance protein CopC [Proteobacteria bacterium]|nr:copper resistance protein CopC [Pseudomonadota bacterium]
MKKTIALIGTIFAAISPFISNHALAHGRITSAMPSANQVVTAPRSIMLHFNERIEPRFSSIELVKPDGTKNTLASSVVGGGLILNALISPALPPGLYTVNWRVVTKGDGHPTNGTYSFTIR